MSTHQAVLPAAPFRISGVEGDPVTRELLGLYLQPRGVQLHLDATVRLSLGTLEREFPDAFFCDEAALADAEADERRLLQTRLARVPVVAILDPGSERQWTRAWTGVVTALRKPLALPAVMALCDQWLAGEPATDGRVRPSGAPLSGLAALVAETDMGPELVDELLASFSERMPAYLAEVRGALADGDLERFRRTLHSVKGMCANLRLEALVALSEPVREAGMSGNRAAAERALQHLQAEFERVAAAVQSRRGIGA